jgi:hypothetical protein
MAFCQGLSGVVTITHLFSIPPSPLQGSARSVGEEGHPPLAGVAEHLGRQPHLSHPRPTQACLHSRLRPVAHLGRVHLVASQLQLPSEQQIVCLGISLYSTFWLTVPP